ncbi:tetratricopeptide repeat protein [Magnetococcales bacterium HHB-1]
MDTRHKSLSLFFVFFLLLSGCVPEKEPDTLAFMDREYEENLKQRHKHKYWNEGKRLLAEKKYFEAAEKFSQAAQFDEMGKKPSQRIIAKALHKAGLSYYHGGHYEQAEDLLLRSLQIHQDLFGLQHLRTAINLNSLAELYRTLGLYYKAEPLLRRTLSIREALLGVDHPETATTLNNLADLYRTIGATYKAEPLFEQALESAEKALGLEHPNVAVVLNNMALLQEATGNYKKAEELHKRALMIREKVLGDNDPNTATSLNNLASLYRNIGKYKESEKLSLRALDILEKKLGPESPRVVSVLDNLALLYQFTARYKKAEAQHLRLLALVEKLFGKDHLKTAVRLNKLVLLYNYLNRKSKAKPHHQRALNIITQALDLRYPGSTVSFYHTAKFSQHMDVYGNAYQLFNTIMKRLERKRAQQPSLANRYHLAKVYYLIGEHRKALPLLRGMLTEVLSKNNPENVWHMQYEYSMLLDGRGVSATAILWGKIAVNQLQKIIQKDPQFFEDKHYVYQRLAVLLTEQERFEEAQEVRQLLVDNRNLSDKSELRQLKLTKKEQPWYQGYQKQLSRLLQKRYRRTAPAQMNAYMKRIQDQLK